MNLLITSIIIGLAGCTLAQFSGYSYNRPSSGGGFGSGFGSGFGGGGGGGNGEYTQVSPGFQTSEGASVDSALLELIRKILLKEELQSQSIGGLGGGGGGGYPSRPSSSYGVPSSQYGAPSEQHEAPNYQNRIVDIEFESIRQSNQVAQFNQVKLEPFPRGAGGVSGGGAAEGAPRISPVPPPSRPTTIAPVALSLAVNMPNRESIRGNIFDLVQRVTDAQ